MMLHGLIHLLGFAKSISPQSISRLTLDISKPVGIIWLICAILFASAAVMFVLNSDWWWKLAIIAAVLSQVIILLGWQDAKFGTIANIVILTIAVAGYASLKFYGTFAGDVREVLTQTDKQNKEMITEEDLKHLPGCVKKYLIFANVIGTEKPRSVRIEFDGEMRSRKMDWFSFTSEQYNTFQDPSRLFFMTGRMYGMNVQGYHSYRNAAASMRIRLFSIIPVADNRGREMDIAETVTIFNDMCLTVPASLTDSRIKWGKSDDNSAEASFTNGDITISAILYFDDSGRLINFVSEDRFDVSSGTPQRLKFSTPVKEYAKVNGMNLLSYGEAVWHYPEGDFVYGKFRLKNIEYNVKNIK
jgi:hypothetical protein